MTRHRPDIKGVQFVIGPDGEYLVVRIAAGGVSIEMTPVQYMALPVLDAEIRPAIDGKGDDDESDGDGEEWNTPA